MTRTFNRLHVVPSGWSPAEWEALIDSLTRRKLIKTGLALGMISILPACGGGNTTETGPLSSSTTRTIQDLFGTVSVPSRPERVIAADSVTLGNMLALGVKPVGAGVNVNSLPGYLADQMQGIADVTGEDDIDLEKVLALNADMIITFGGSTDDPFNQELCERYKRALPTFCYDYWYSTEEEIKRNLTEVARVLGRDAEARQVIQQYDQRVQDLKAKVEQAGLTDKPVSVIRISEGQDYSIRIGTSESIVFRAIGLRQPEGQRNPEDFSIEFSLENLNILNQAHAVFVYVDDNAKGQESAIFDTVVWKGLEPVKAGRVYSVNSGIWNSSDLIGAMRIMDDIERLLIDPALQS